MTEVACDYSGRSTSHCGRRKQGSDSGKHNGKKNGDFPSIREESISAVVLIMTEGRTQGRREDCGSWG